MLSRLVSLIIRVWARFFQSSENDMICYCIYFNTLKIMVASHSLVLSFSLASPVNHQSGDTP